MVMLKIGVSACDFPLNEMWFCKLSEAGIDAVEVFVTCDNWKEMDFPEIQRLAEQYGIILWSCHLPFHRIDVLDVASQNEALRLKSVNTCCEVVRRAAAAGIRKFVVHPSSEPKSEDADGRELEMQQAMKSLRTLAQVADENGSVIAVENLPRSCLGRTAEELLELVSADARLKICFDTNHLLGVDLYDFIDRIAERIVTLHVSDYDFVNERHWLPGEGKIQWQKLCHKLLEVGYEGVWLYEIDLQCPPTILRDRDLELTDFSRNAREIFENRPLTVIGRPKENLGMWD